MNGKGWIGAALSVGLVVGAAGAALSHGPGGAMTGGPGGYYGHGMGHGMMMGSGAMGQGPGPGMMMAPGAHHHHGTGHGLAHGMGPGMTGHGIGPGWIYGMPDVSDRDLDADDVRRILERRLAWHGNPRLKLGQVTEADDDTILAEIVTVDDSLVQRLSVDRHRGVITEAE